MTLTGELFPPAFRDLLQQALRAAPRLHMRVEDAVRARRRRQAQSGTFAGHRHYSEGDDLRFLDWNAYARTGSLYVKQLEEEERRVLMLVLDCSPSMATGEPLRLRGALRLAAILGGLALVHLDGVRVVARAGQEAFHEGGAAVPRLLGKLERLETGSEDPLELARRAIAEGPVGRVCWISDFARPAEFEPAVAWLRRHGARCTGWLPSVPYDHEVPALGWIRLSDPESGSEVRLRVDAAMRDALAAELRVLRRQQDQVFAGAGYPLRRFPLPAEGDFRLAAWMEQLWTFRS